MIKTSQAYRKQYERLERNHAKRIYKLMLIISARFDNKIACVKCGYSGLALEIDHIRNNGNQDRKKLTRNAFISYYLLHPQQAQQNLMLLCANCNKEKEHKNRNRKLDL